VKYNEAVIDVPGEPEENYEDTSRNVFFRGAPQYQKGKEKTVP